MNYEQALDTAELADKEVLVLPDDIDNERKKKLEAKVEEYKTRLQRYSAEGADVQSAKYQDAIVKMVLLGKLLDGGKISKREVYDQVLGDLGYVNQHRLDMAFEVIQDYISSGGVNTQGGTGF